MQVQRSVPVPETDHSHGLQAKGVRGAQQHPTSAGNRVAGRLDRVEVVLEATEAHVLGMEVVHATGHGGVGSVGAQLGAEPV